MKIKHILTISSLLVVNSAYAGTFKAFDARSAAMGGTGVASAQIVSSPFYNPAMLAAQHEEEDFSLLIGAGAAVQDDDNLIEHLENFVDAYNASQFATANSEAILAGASKPASLQVNAFGVLGWAGDTWSMAVAGNGYVQSDVGFTYSGANGSTSTLDLAGVKVMESSFSLARKFGSFSIGITPKQVDVTSYVSASSLALNNGDIDQILDALETTGQTDHGTELNLDVGLVYKVSENIKVGVVHQNALSKDYTGVSSKKFSFNPTTRAGIAYTGDIITLAIDYDLTENDPIIQGGDKTQYMAAGVEFDLLDSLQFRGGYNQNLAVSGSEPTLSAGIGLNLLAIQLDLTAMQNNDALSAFLQLGVRW